MIRLQRGRVLRVPQGAGKTVIAHAGTLWITEQGSPRDVMLQSGERFTFIQSGLAVVEAFTDASLSLES